MEVRKERRGGEGGEARREEGMEGGKRRTIKPHSLSVLPLNAQAAIGIRLWRRSSGIPWGITCGIGKGGKEGGRGGGGEGGKEECYVFQIYIHPPPPASIPPHSLPPFIASSLRVLGNELGLLLDLRKGGRKVEVPPSIPPLPCRRRR